MGEILIIITLATIIAICGIVIGLKQSFNNSSDNDRSNKEDWSREKIDEYVKIQKEKASAKFISISSDNIVSSNMSNKISQIKADDTINIPHFTKKPSLDSTIKAMNGFGIELRVLSTKYLDDNSKLKAMILEVGDDVFLKVEINPFSNTESIAVYSGDYVLLGYVASGQKNRALEHMYKEKIQGFIKEPWSTNKSWFSIVIADVNS